MNGNFTTTEYFMFSIAGFIVYDLIKSAVRESVRPRGMRPRFDPPMPPVHRRPDPTPAPPRAETERW